MKILVLGATGMLGHTLLEVLAESLEVTGTVRARTSEYSVHPILGKHPLIGNVQIENSDTLISVIDSVRPDVVVNCTGIIKQLQAAKDPLISITINALIPHRIAHICSTAGVRMIHISTDCVFSGKKGHYNENDVSDAEDLYGRTKYLGEVTYPHCVTLRTSIIGHELKGGLGLIDWFLAQKEKARGYTRAIYTGFPTVEMAEIIKDYVLPNKELKGLYHVSSDPISKYELLRMVAEHYGKEIEIEPNDEFFCDRSMDSEIFQSASGYRPPSWPELVERMHAHFAASPCYGEQKDKRV